MTGETEYEPWAGNLLEKVRLTLKVYRHPWPPPRLMIKTVEAIKENFSEVTPKKPDPYDLVAVRLALTAAWKERKTLDGLTRRDLRRAPWVLFHGENPLGGINGLARAYLIWLNREGSASAVTTLLRVFLRDYPENLPTFELWRKGLRAVLADKQAQSLVKWKERCRKFSYLEPNGCRSFAETYKNSEAAAEDFLNQAGLTGDLAGANFLYAALLFLVDLEDDLRKKRLAPGRLNRSFDLLVKADGRLRFPEHRVEVIERLLDPFDQENRLDQNEIFNKIAKFLIKTFGHPEFGETKINWHGVKLSAKQIILRWLAGVTLEDFFRILDYTVKTGEYSHHWPYRKAFWSAYFKIRRITEAWVLLGPAAQRYVKTIKDWEYKGHGRLLKGSGVLANHSVLLLKFNGGLVLAEWSHNGKGRFWLPGNKKGPDFYRSAYSRNEVIDYCDYDFVHSGSATYSWQRKVAQWIFERTGIYIHESEYKVKS